MTPLTKRLIPLVCALSLGIFFLFPPPPSSEAKDGFNLLSPEKEAAMGKQEFEKYKKERSVVSRGSQHDMTQRVASRLVPFVKVPNAQWEFVVFKDDTPNAFALPGGKVGVHTGLFKVVANESQLAAVIGHELGHVTARHSGQRISNAVVGAGVAGIVGKILENKTGMNGRTSQTITQGANTLRVLKFSREQELEADQLGALYMAKAGYDPAEAVELWKRFSAYKAQSQSGAPPAFLSTHPVDSRRIQDLQAYLPEARKSYKGPNSTQPPSPPTTSPSAPSAKPPKALRVQ